MTLPVFLLIQVAIILRMRILINAIKDLAKVYNMIIVLAVPSSNTYIKATGHMSSLEEVAPYHIYADRVVILHNPIETGDKHMLGYETGDFVNPRTGICYLRTAFMPIIGP
jgi:hypothetical protein